MESKLSIASEQRMCKTIKQKVRFKAPPDTIYRLLADSRQRTEVTGLKAVISNKVGGKFSTDAGQVTGVNVDLLPGRRLVQAWRRNDFPDGIYSMAAITLVPTQSGGTELVLTHRGVPKHLLDQIDDYWRRFCWARLKAY
jgi:uncharacterized protein YndB with AHSA1/START domain